jgi:YidC/Oxa1 family membrane protein insertase
MIHVAALLASGSTTVTTVAANATKHSSGSILDPIAKPIAWLLAEIYAVIPNYGVAIIILSIIWMALISPLNLKSTRSMLAMQKLQPELKKLQEKHKNDRQAFAQAQMELFREHGVSPFGACLPMLLPLPIFFALFRVIDGLSHTVNGVSMPKYIPPSSEMYKNIQAAHGQINAFGMNLSQSALAHHSSFAAALPYWILLLVMGATSYFQSAMIMSRNQANAQANPQMQMQMRMMKFLPLVFVVFCIRFPAGVILYYAMSNVCRIVQQDAMYRFDPKVKALVVKEVQEVEDLTEKIDEEGGPAGSGLAGGAKGTKPARPKPASGGATSRSDAATASAGQANGAGGGAENGAGGGTENGAESAAGGGTENGAESAAGGGAENAAGGGVTPKPDAKTGGRAWFRGLLENAEQEQRARTAAKAAGAAGAAAAAGTAAKRSTKPNPSSSKGRTAGGNSSGNSRAGGTAASGNGSASTSKNRSQPNKSRTNRKRRGR